MEYITLNQPVGDKELYLACAKYIPQGRAVEVHNNSRKKETALAIKIEKGRSKILGDVLNSLRFHKRIQVVSSDRVTKTRQINRVWRILNAEEKEDTKTSP